MSPVHDDHSPISTLAARVAQRTGREEERRARAERQLMEQDVNVTSFVLDVVGRRIPDIDVAGSLTTGEVLRTVEGASQVTVTIHDRAHVILASGALEDRDNELRAVDVKLDGLWFRLVKLSKSGPDLNLTLEDRDVADLRAKRGPRKAASRAKVTRAQYVLTLVRAVRRRRIPVNIPNLSQKQPIGRGKRAVAETRDKQRRKGFGDNERIEGVSKSQLRRIERCMIVAEETKGVTDRVVLAMLVAGFGESEWGENLGKRGTTFQTTQIPERQLELQAKHFLIGGRSFRAGGAVGYARANPGATPGEIASKVEISDQGAAHYDKHRGRARRVLKAWGGAPDDASGKAYTKRYTYRVEPKESYWDAIQRLAAEVGWRAFVSAGTFHYISEEELFKSRHRYRFSEETPGVNTIDFDWDYRKKVAKATVACRIDKWGAPPGTVVVVDGLGPASGRWLVESIRRDLFSPEAEISLKKPMRERPEPRGETATRAAGGSSSGSGGEEIGTGLRYPLAVKGKFLGGVAAHMARAFGNWQSDRAVDIGCPQGTDVYAIEDCTVTKLGGSWRGGRGNPDGFNLTITAKGSGRQWFYTHLKTRANLRVGQSLGAGDYIGESGAANGVDHVHIGVNKGDPQQILKVGR